MSFDLRSELLGALQSSRPGQPAAYVLRQHHAIEHATVTLAAPAPAVQVGDGYDVLVGYGDETVCLHDLLYGIRGGRVEVVWPILGRGKLR